LHQPVAQEQVKQPALTLLCLITDSSPCYQGYAQQEMGGKKLRCGYFVIFIDESL
jgi:hypothetical protein